MSIIENGMCNVRKKFVIDIYYHFFNNKNFILVPTCSRKKNQLLLDDIQVSVIFSSDDNVISAQILFSSCVLYPLKMRNYTSEKEFYLEKNE